MCELSEKLIRMGKEEGLEEGKIEGALNKSIEIAKALLRTEATVDYVAKITGLPYEDVKKLALEQELQDS